MTRFRLPNGKIVEKDDLYDALMDDLYTEDDYCQYLNDEDFKEVVDDASADVLRVLSPTDFRLSYLEEIDFMYEDRDHGSLLGIGFEKVGSRWRLPDGKTVSDKAMYDHIADYYTEDDHEDYLSELQLSELNVTLPKAGDFLRKVDPYAFRSGYNDYIDMLVEDAEHGGLEWLGIEVVDSSDNKKPAKKTIKRSAKKPASKPKAGPKVRK